MLQGKFGLAEHGAVTALSLEEPPFRGLLASIEKTVRGGSCIAPVECWEWWKG